MSLDEDLQFYLDKSDEPQVVKRAQKKEKRNSESRNSESQECPPEYFQDAQLPDDSMNIDEVGRMFNIDINDDSQQPQEKEPENMYLNVQMITTDVARNISSSSKWTTKQVVCNV
ncbi:unnamed protein product [Brassica rapa]|uniref:Uncharacterized protein n=1 Tax=Brassica campestris TaxID=3711 RepID=A0A8D9D715_BRACM|nr:unnamed protein product [Brassica rapa]